MWKYTYDILKFSSPELLGQSQPNLKQSILGIRKLKLIHSNEGPCIFPRLDNSQTVKIHWKHWKSSTEEQLCQLQWNLAQIILEWSGFKGHLLLKGGIIGKQKCSE